MQIERLGKDDYQECIDFINMVFSMSSGPTNFPELLPAYYQETEVSMQCHYVLREHGAIKALVGLYPGTVRIGRETLRLARIGAVSTHPYSQGKGYMKTLMNHCMNVVRTEYDISHLGGLRQRYLYFGYEKCGYVPVFTLNRHNLRHNELAAEVVLEEVSQGDPALMDVLKTIHDDQPIRGERSLAAFYRICRNWSNHLFLARVADDIVGYAVVEAEFKGISELIATRSEFALGIAQAVLQRSGGQSLAVTLNPAACDDIRLFGAFAEDVRVDHGGNWQIVNWQKTLSALAKVKNQNLPLPNGEVILDITDTACLCLRVADGNVSVTETKQPADLSGSPSQMARLLFGPLQPGMVDSLPAHSGLLQAWLPLPLYLPQQDHA